MSKGFTKKQEHELAEWCIQQAKLFKEGKLEKWKIEKLKEMNFPFDYYMEMLG